MSLKIPFFVLMVLILFPGSSTAGQATSDLLKETSIPETERISTLLSDTSALEQCKCSYHIRFNVFKKEKSVLDAVSRKVYVYAIMSSNAYDDKLQIKIPGWKRLKRYEISKHGFSADLYLSEDGKKIVIAFRGTTKGSKDWRYGNADINTDGQYGDADVLFKKVVSDYPGKRIVTTGHSLGGGLAMHLALLNQGVDAVVFNPSPRVFAHKNYDRYANTITVIHETGEILGSVRQLFTTLKKIKHQSYRYNFLGGSALKEHGIEPFARCMYASLHKQESHYERYCKKNSLRK